MNPGQGVAIGMGVTAFFGTVWWLVALRFVKASPLRVGMILLGALVLAAGTFHLWERHAADPPAEFMEPHWQTFHLVVNVEWIAILLAVVVLRSVDRPDLIISVIALIVGLHFLPLAGVFGGWLYDFAAAGMIFGAALGFISRDFDRRRAVTCACCGATLWLCAAGSYALGH